MTNKDKLNEKNRLNKIIDEKISIIEQTNKIVKDKEKIIERKENILSNNIEKNKIEKEKIINKNEIYTQQLINTITKLKENINALNITMID